MSPLALPLLLTLELPEPTPSNNVIKGMHYRVYKALRQHWSKMIRNAVPNHDVWNVPSLQRSFICIERHSAGAGLDWDNAYGGLKPLLDCLVRESARNPDGLGFILDDSPAHMPYPPLITQLKAKKNAGKTVVRIYDADGFTLEAPAFLRQ